MNAKSEKSKTQIDWGLNLLLMVVYSSPIPSCRAKQSYYAETSQIPMMVQSSSEVNYAESVVLYLGSEAKLPG